MKVRRTNESPSVWRALLTGLCAGAVAAAALGSPAAFAAGKSQRHVGHGSLPVKGSIAAKFPSLPTGPHPSEVNSKQKIKPNPL